MQAAWPAFPTRILTDGVPSSRVLYESVGKMSFNVSPAPRKILADDPSSQTESWMYPPHRKPRWAG
jgi:hypothetical protein